MGRDTVRMGKQRNFPTLKLLIFLISAVVVVVIVVIVMLRHDEPTADKAHRCESNGDCARGSMCAAGGCLVMLSDEHLGMWRDDIMAQIDAGVPWRPLSAFGEKIAPTPICPATEGKVTSPDKKHTTPKVAVTVYEVDLDWIKVHKQQKVQGTMWLDSIRFWFPGKKTLQTTDLCVSASVDRVALARKTAHGYQGTRVDTSLRQSVPVGAVAAATLTARSDLPEEKKDGMRTLSFPLPPVTGREAIARTVLAVPLGADLSSIEGPPPIKQRLLTGYVAYYWTHGDTQSDVTVVFRVPRTKMGNLDLDELNP